MKQQTTGQLRPIALAALLLLAERARMARPLLLQLAPRESKSRTLDDASDDQCYA